MITFKNTKNKPADKGLDHLIKNGIVPICYKNDRVYDAETAELRNEAQNIFVEFKQENLDSGSNLLQDWLYSNS